jgi:hypothetical protein
MFIFFDGVPSRSSLDFSLVMFKTTFIHLAHLLVSGLSSMVFEHLQNLFDLEDLTIRFS